MASHAADDESVGAAFDPVARAVRNVQTRMRMQRLFDASCVGAVLALLFAAVLLAMHKTGTVELRLSWLSCCVAFPLLLAAASALRRIPPLEAARLADQAHGLRDLLSSAWVFAREPQATRFMQACIARAVDRAPSVEPARAVVLHAPRAAPGVMLALATLALVAALEVPAREAIAAPPPPRLHLLASDDVEAFREGLRELAIDGRHDPELSRRAEALNAMLEAVAEGSLPQAEALQAIEALQAALAEGEDGDAEALRAALAELGQSLEGAELGKAAAEALAKGDAQRAAQALDDVAKTLPEAPKARQRELARRLERAGTAPKPDEGRLERAKRELDRLLNKRKEAGQEKASPREQRLLKKKKRELDRLRREHEQQQRMRRELEQLRRELGGASDQLRRGNQGEASRQLSEGARELSRMAQRQRTDEQRQGLRRQLEQLREMIRRQAQRSEGQQGQAGKKRLSLGRFSKDARGQHPGGKRDGKQGEGADQAQGEVLVPGSGKPGGDAVVLPGMAEAEASAPSLGAPGGDGRGAGEGGRPEEAEATDLDARTVDVRVTGAEGEGPSRAEVIREASSRGFASRSYRKVHTDYQRHAEEVLERDQVPGGYRFYVRRYFQLIRPREAPP